MKISFQKFIATSNVFLPSLFPSSDFNFSKKLEKLVFFYDFTTVDIIIFLFDDEDRKKLNFYVIQVSNLYCFILSLYIR